jgi:hypothetical protein
VGIKDKRTAHVAYESRFHRCGKFEKCVWGVARSGGRRRCRAARGCCLLVLVVVGKITVCMVYVQVAYVEFAGGRSRSGACGRGTGGPRAWAGWACRSETRRRWPRPPAWTDPA